MTMRNLTCNQGNELSIIIYSEEALRLSFCNRKVPWLSLDKSHLKNDQLSIDKQSGKYSVPDYLNSVLRTINPLWDHRVDGDHVDFPLTTRLSDKVIQRMNT